jgi:hypothetical protein
VSDLYGYTNLNLKVTILQMFAVILNIAGSINFGYFVTGKVLDISAFIESSQCSSLQLKCVATISFFKTVSEKRRNTGRRDWLTAQPGKAILYYIF